MSAFDSTQTFTGWHSGNRRSTLSHAERYVVDAEVSILTLIKGHLGELDIITPRKREMRAYSTHLIGLV
jgi:hypothetical protein